MGNQYPDAAYPEIEPYDHGLLDVGDGHHVYWETSGNPAGKPAVVLHGGPGSGRSVHTRRYFDPDAYRIVQFDQRGCGRSTPHAGEPDPDLSANTTAHLLADLERLRTHLGIERWLVFAASWGAVLGLVYAQRHPERVSEMALAGVATGRRGETDLLTRGLGPLFPEAWARFRDGVPAAEREGDLSAAYLRLLLDPDPAVHERAARDWCDWEDAMLPLAVGPHPRFGDPVYRLAFARLVTHYWSNGCWLDEGAVLRDADRLTGIPAVIVQGTLDLSNLSGSPWQLAAAWPDAELVMIDDSGHDGGPGMTAAWIAATDRFAARSDAP
ncbi:prolyl aminopeptidase [Amycolatopsis antarctica]|uniref:Proline iminopeptidase n=1 Tax=Amycolatopsis antarctica TaxID=1854586 RepID=A0A263CVM2_9PSEU|nr:prolyl aminopeptidase [Amycolatopsis antarctica]OZM70009.1 prolyl aminopeptidase [Amycolatopsis antarctica]